MTDSSPDDGWDELARELGLDKTPSAAARPSTPVERAKETLFPIDPETESAEEFHHPEDDVDDAELGGVEGGDDAELEAEEGEDGEGDSAEGEPAGGEGAADEGQPGTKKRRRRRRRRKKGATPSPAEAALPSNTIEEAPAPAAARPAVARPEPTRPEPARPLPKPQLTARHAVRDDVFAADASDYSGDEEESRGGLALAAEEDTGGEVLRELIATWNVPAWDEIVSGLHRPER